jgi:hypothetical protein
MLLIASLYKKVWVFQLQADIQQVEQAQMKLVEFLKIV